MMAEDTKHALDNAQKFIQIGAHMLTNGFALKGAWHQHLKAMADSRSGLPTGFSTSKMNGILNQ